MKRQAFEPCRFLLPPVDGRGAADWDVRPQSITIDRAGTYYVVMQHTKAATFTFRRCETACPVGPTR